MGGPSADELDAFTFAPYAFDEGVNGHPFAWSVDRTSVGAPGLPATLEAAAGQAAGDLFRNGGFLPSPVFQTLYGNQADQFS